ncbi:MAG: hypothetical protein U0X91_30120 [Spirosomataceae bacterium]
MKEMTEALQQVGWPNVKSADPLGLLFDAVFLLFNLWAEPFLHRYVQLGLFSDVSGNAAHPTLGWLIIGAVAAQGVGLYLRRKRASEAAEQNRPWESCFALPLFFILIFHFTLFGIFLVIVGVVSIAPEASGGSFFLCAPIVLFMTWQAIQTTRPQYYGPPAISERIRDGLGTLLLIFSGIVLTSVAWSGLITNNVMQGNFSHDSVGDKVGYTLVLLLFFGTYYLPARLAFLMSDFNKWSGWLRYGIVFLPLAKKIWLG